MFNWLFRQKKEKAPEYPRHAFDDIDREYSEVIRKERSEIRRIKSQIEIAQLKAELMSLKAQFEEENAENSGNGEIDGAFANILRLLQLKGSNSPNAPESSGVELSDAEIDELIAATPPDMLKKAKKSPDTLIRTALKAQFPALSENTVKRAIERLKV